VTDASNSRSPRAQPAGPMATRRPYIPPRIVDYGSVSKLTQTGGVTTMDTGSMKAILT
jgi:hypothetical protein